MFQSMVVANDQLIVFDATRVRVECKIVANVGAEAMRSQYSDNGVLTGPLFIGAQATEQVALRDVSAIVAKHHETRRVPTRIVDNLIIARNR